MPLSSNKPPRAICMIAGSKGKWLAPSISRLTMFYHRRHHPASISSFSFAVSPSPCFSHFYRLLLYPMPAIFMDITWHGSFRCRCHCRRVTPFLINACRIHQYRFAIPKSHRLIRYISAGICVRARVCVRTAPTIYYY